MSSILLPTGREPSTWLVLATVFGLVTLFVATAVFSVLRMGYFARPEMARPEMPRPEMPQFPWPPPQASARTIVSRTLLASGGEALITYRDMADVLTTALHSSGYSEQAFMAVPGGFALVTRLERINPNGRPVADPNRWPASGSTSRRFSLAAYIAALFHAEPGFYRLIVFIATAEPFSQSRAGVSERDAREWLREGFNILPEAVAERPLGSDVACTALIYEFELPDRGTEPIQLTPGRLGADAHLKASGFLQALRSR